MTKKNGRPTDYNVKFNRLAFRYCLLGATDEDLARFFEVSEVTINAWKKKHPQFLKSLKAGKDEADSKVAEAMYNRALGYEHKEDKIFCNGGKIVVQETTKHYPPCEKAALNWLKNRQPDKWRDKVETVLTGTDGGPLQVNVTVTKTYKKKSDGNG